MLLDGASGLLLILGISVVLNVVVFMYFRNKTTALENKVDVMFNIVQEHAAINQRQQQQHQQQMADPMNEQQTMNQNDENIQENNDLDESSVVTQPSDENPNLISVSDDETDDDSDDSDDDSEDESDEELENTVI